MCETPEVDDEYGLTAIFTTSTHQHQITTQKRAISSLPERPPTAGIKPPPLSSPPPSAKKGKKGKKAEADFSKPPLSELLDEIEDQV